MKIHIFLSKTCWSTREFHNQPQSCVFIKNSQILLVKNAKLRSIFLCKRMREIFGNVDKQGTALLGLFFETDRALLPAWWPFKLSVPGLNIVNKVRSFYIQLIKDYKLPFIHDHGWQSHILSELSWINMWMNMNKWPWHRLLHAWLFQFSPKS
jgi:hypothetical protein